MEESQQHGTIELNLLITSSRLRRGPMVGLLQAFWAAFDPRESLEQRGMRLLRAHLTPAQRQQFERCRFFEVVGGCGCCTRRLCFSPCGHLPLGDMLLAQKISLELFEDAALAVAGRWGTNRPRPWFRCRHS
jgi:hypothetical protein